MESSKLDNLESNPPMENLDWIISRNRGGERRRRRRLGIEPTNGGGPELGGDLAGLLETERGEMTQRLHHGADPGDELLPAAPIPQLPHPLDLQPPSFLLHQPPPDDLKRVTERAMKTSPNP